MNWLIANPFMPVLVILHVNGESFGVVEVKETLALRYKYPT